MLKQTFPTPEDAIIGAKKIGENLKRVSAFWC